ncbi:MAG: hypothetical protein L6Q38_09330 [Nitrospira sp.]|nr:hypothetical protein [Nitrospira sp.]
MALARLGKGVRGCWRFYRFWIIGDGASTSFTIGRFESVSMAVGRSGSGLGTGSGSGFAGFPIQLEAQFVA